MSPSHFARPLAMTFMALVFGVSGSVQEGVAQISIGDEACSFSSVIDLRTGLPSSAATLFGEASATQIIFAGERHGTPEHVQLATCLLAAKDGSRPPVLALEHVPANSQSELDDWRRNHAFDPNLLADFVGWEALGWPDYRIYRPLITEAGQIGAHIIGTDQPAPGAGGPARETLLEVAPAYGLQTDDIVAAWVPDMIASHCDLIDDEAATRIALTQMERDSIMAGRLIAGRGRGPTTLYFGGKSHTRIDLSIPYLIARTDRPPSMLSVAAFTEDEWETVLQGTGVLGLRGVYDYAVIAGQSNPTDEALCEDMRSMMGR